MSSLIIEVVTIDEIRPHPNADKMDLAFVKGWQLCVAKNGYKKGTIGVYFPIDSLVPLEVAKALDFDKYLAVKQGEDKGRVRAVKLRGEPSYGVFVPVKVVTDYLIKKKFSEQNGNTKTIGRILPIGYDVADELGVEKWEPPLLLSSHEIERPHTLFDKYTNIENFRHYPNVINNEDDVIFTEKLHGSNQRTALIDGEYMVGTHNMRVKENINNKYWYVVNDNMKNLLLELSESVNGAPVIMYGEIFGPKIQKGFTYGIKQGDLGYRCFDIKVDGKYLDYLTWKTICVKHNVPIVPVLYRGKFSMEKLEEFSNIDSTIENTSHMMEGIVIKLVSEELRYYKVGTSKRVILKYVWDRYLTRKGERTEYK